MVPDSAWAFFALGSCYFRQANQEEALAHLERAVELEPDRVLWLMGLANAYRDSGMHDEAAAAYQQVLGLEPNNHNAAAALEALEP